MRAKKNKLGCDSGMPQKRSKTNMQTGDGRIGHQQGNISLPFNTAGMYRGYVDSTGQLVIKIYK